KAVALQSTSDSGLTRKQQKAEGHCAPCSPWFTQPVSALDGAVVQRKATCACGGGCPGCKNDSQALEIRTKHVISMPGAEFEQEADRVADQVLRMADPGAGPIRPPSVSTRLPFQRKCAECAEEEEEGEKAPVQIKEARDATPHLSSRQP